MKERPKRKSFKNKILVIVLLSIFILTTALCYLFFTFSKKRIEYMTGESIKGIAATTANFISADEMALIIAQSQKIWGKYNSIRMGAVEYRQGRVVPTPESHDDLLRSARKNYVRYVKLLASTKKINKLDSPINIYSRTRNRLSLVLTSDESLLLGAAYSMRKEAKAVFKNAIPKATKLYKDKDGVWISAYAPIMGPGTKTIPAIVEINYKLDAYLRQLYRTLATILLISACGLAGVFLISYPLVNKLVSDINKLDQFATNLQQADYSTKIEVTSDDEVGHLAETFEHLRLSIRDSIQKLKGSLRREKRAHLESIIALTNTIELRDPYTRGHVFRVEKYALLIAKAMRLSREQQERLKYGCYLHDIGKIDVETSLLRKKEKLSKEDFEKIKKHAEKGAQVVEGIRFLKDVKDIILHHQERYDGKGYPKGLKRDEIPLLARIIAVADSFDAMTTDRPYSPRMSFKHALKEVEKNAGIQFDPDVAAAFLRYKDHIEAITKKHFAGLGEIS